MEKKLLDYLGIVCWPLGGGGGSCVMINAIQTLLIASYANYMKHYALSVFCLDMVTHPTHLHW